MMFTFKLVSYGNSTHLLLAFLDKIHCHSEYGETDDLLWTFHYKEIGTNAAEKKAVHRLAGMCQRA